MMHTTASAAPMIWLHIHFLFMAMAVFGFIAALFWLFKHGNKKSFLNVVWITLGVGVLGGILTASVAMSGWEQMMDIHHDSWGENDWDDRREEMWEAMEDYWEDLDDVEFEDMEDMMDEMMGEDEENNS